jgi:hypothetical protein
MPKPTVLLIILGIKSNIPDIKHNILNTLLIFPKKYIYPSNPEEIIIIAKTAILKEAKIFITSPCISIAGSNTNKTGRKNNIEPNRIDKKPVLERKY